MSFADIATELGSGTKKRSGFGAIADDFAPVERPSSTAAPEYKFQTSDPAELRRKLVAAGEPAVVAAFDRHFPDLTPQAPASPAGPVLRGAAAVPGDPRVAQQPDAPQAPEPSWWQKARAGGEAAVNTVAGAVGGGAGMVYGGLEAVGENIGALASGNKPTMSVEQQAALRARQFTPELPKALQTDLGQEYTGRVGEFVQTHGPSIIGPEALALGEAMRPVARSGMDNMRAQFAEKQAAAPRIEPTMTKPRYGVVDGKIQRIDQPAEVTTVTSAKGATVPFDTTPVEGGLPKTATPDRAAVLRRIGLEDVRTSAVSGNIAEAGKDFQVSKYTSEPAGLAAKAQFDAERQALVTHGEKTVQATGGTLGLDQDAVNARGQTIAKPFDGLRQWFDKAKGDLYRQADERSKGLPVVSTGEIESLLNDRSFNNSAMAQDKGNLVSAIKNQLELFKENNPKGLTVKTTEDFNKWLNQNWSPDNSKIIAQVRHAMDEAVTKGAGEDVYGKARELHQFEKQTLDNPNGVAKLMDFDPKTPINRVTPYNKIPDTLTRLSPDQFKNVVDTLKKMPPELQTDAQAAIAEIQAHYANKAMDAGANNKGQWNAKRVTDFRKANGSNIGIAFESNPEALGMLNDLQSAGHILDFPSSYPGASAQAAQALKRGLMSGITQKAGAFVGGGAGTVFGPAGAAIGAAAGEAVGSRMGQSMAEKAALKRWQSGVTKLSDFPQ